MAPIALYFLLMIGVFMPVLCIRSYFRMKAGAPFPPKPAFHRQTLFMELAFLALSLLTAVSTKMRLFPRAVPGPKDWGMGAVVLAGFVAFMYPIWKHNAATKREKVYRRMPASESELGLWSVVAVTAGVVEEITYRGVLFGILLYWLGHWWIAAVLCAISFALGHAIQGLKATVIIFAMSLVFQGLVWATGSLYVAMAVHAIYDIIAGVMYARFYKLPATSIPQPSSEPA